MNYIMHRTIAALQDDGLNEIADELAIPLSSISENISCQNEVLVIQDGKLQEQKLISSRSRESHIVFLSGMSDLALIPKLKSLKQVPFVIWSDLNVPEQQLKEINLPIDVYAKSLSTGEEKANSLYSKLTNEKICLYASTFQVKPCYLHEMSEVVEGLHERIQNITFRVHAMSPKVTELGNGEYILKSSLKSGRKRRSYSADEVVEGDRYQIIEDIAAQERGRRQWELDKARKAQAKASAAVVSSPFWELKTAQIAAVGTAVALGATIAYLHRGGSKG